MVRVLFGVTIPRTRVCPDHCSPFDAFADAYFRTCTIGQGEPYPITRVIWHASRGLAGKSKTLATLGLTVGYVDGAEITVLGGSQAQSTNVHRYMTAGMESQNLPREMTLDVTATKITLTNASEMRPLPASQKTVRGPHPSVLLMDEVDEMDLDIYDAALGQPMPQPNNFGYQVPVLTVISSTWQNPDGTLTEIFKRQEEQEPINDQGDALTPIYRWCVARGSRIVTSRGEVPIEEVTNRDLVLTRQGWRHVQHVTAMGYKPTVRLDAGESSLRVTADHQVATPEGWRPAGALAADAMAAARPDVGVLRGEEMALAAGGTAVAEQPRPAHVLGAGDRVQVLDVDAGPVAAQVIGLMSGWDRAYDVLPDPAVGVDGRASAAFQDNTADAVAIAFGPRPLDAASGEHETIVLPVYDIGVEGDAHEFVANGIVVHNCYKENHVDANPVTVIDLASNETVGRISAEAAKHIENATLAKSPEGWLTQATIDDKKNSVSAEMFRVEYDLGEPAIGNRAIDTAQLDLCFDDLRRPIREKHIKDWDEWCFEEPAPGAVYVCGADWAKENDKTVISVVRVDGQRKSLAYAVRMNRFNYPTMIGRYNELVTHYGVGLDGYWHDATGLGNVVNDYLDDKARAFQMVGDKRTKLFSEFVNSIEKVTWSLPKMLLIFYTKLKFTRTGDLYHTEGTGTDGKKWHPPDEFVSLALCHHASTKVVRMATPVGVAKDGTPGKMERHFQHPNEEFTRVEGPKMPGAKRIDLAV